MKHYLSLLGMAGILAACSSNPPVESGTQGAAQPPARQATAPAASASQSATPGTTGTQPARADAADPAKRSVYFDYDSNIVKDEYTPVVTANARYASTHRAAHVVVEGNTDERGSREYNLALGQRRADAVKQRMTLLGVPAQQIETISYGEEKPRVDAETEQAYAQNRRADIVYR